MAERGDDGSGAQGIMILRAVSLLSVLALASLASAQAPPGVHVAPVRAELPEVTEVEPSMDEGGGSDAPDPETDADDDVVSAIAELPRGRIHWDPSWPRYRLDELVLTLGMGLVIGLAELLPTRADPNWSGITDFDTAVADGLGLDSAADRDAIQITSDVLVATSVVWPLLFDSILYAGLIHGSWDAAWQLSLISLEVFAINHALNIAIKLLSRRERPVNTYCRDRPEYAAEDPACQPGSLPPAESFWSGHVSNAFAGAALVCMHHDMLDLFGDAVSDGMACASAVALAATTGLFRMMSDRHWITDVITGSIVGTLIGTLVPYLLHFQGGARPPLRGADTPLMTFLPMVGEDRIGMNAIGVW
jgi:membrane-associated phospholipid phosphatase